MLIKIKASGARPRADRWDTVNLNQLLTGYAVSVYAEPDNFIADRIAPVVRVNKTPGLYPIFNNVEVIRDNFDLEVAPGAASSKMNRDYSSGTYECIEYGIANDIPDAERDNADPIIAPEMDATRQLVRKQRLSREVRVGTIFMNSALWGGTAAATDEWNDTGPDIEADIDAAKLAVIKNCGMPANTIIIPPAAAVVAKKDSDIRDLVVNTASDLLVNGDLPPRLFNLQVIIPTSIIDTADPGIATAVEDFTWNTDNVWVGYVNPSPQPAKGDLTAASTFRQPLEGQIDVATYRWYDNDGHKTVIDTRLRETVEVVSAGAGYVITNVLT